MQLSWPPNYILMLYEEAATGISSIKKELLKFIILKITN